MRAIGDAVSDAEGERHRREFVEGYTKLTQKVD
jgi:hypothetical protein